MDMSKNNVNIFLFLLFIITFIRPLTRDFYLDTLKYKPCFFFYYSNYIVKSQPVGYKLDYSCIESLTESEFSFSISVTTGNYKREKRTGTSLNLYRRNDNE